MNENPFRDNAKSGQWLLRDQEDKLRGVLVRFVPSSIETYHLTLCSLFWAAGVVVFGFLAQTNIHWLWLSSLMVIGHYITDLLDGTVGRIRNTGLIRWGYFMDHLLDFVFFTALLLSFAFVLPENLVPTFIYLAFIQAGFMVTIFLSYGASKKLEISFAGFGPTEIRLLYIAACVFIILFGADLPSIILPQVAIIMTAVFIVYVYLTQKMIWELDMTDKANSQNQQKED